jgi:CRISPR-associated protein Csh1
LEGVLTRFLLDIQYAQRGSTPFEAKLHWLKLDERRVKKLLPEIVEKLREYKLGYPQLEELISKNLIEAGQDWKLSEDETSYCFTLGLSLGRVFKKGRE